jgi:hypothetical protein
MTNLSEDCQVCGPHTNMGLSKYKTGVLPNQLQHEDCLIFHYQIRIALVYVYIQIMYNYLFPSDKQLQITVT